MAMTCLDRAREGSTRGFALLIAVIFMSVMLTFGLTLAALGYKQQILASAAAQSQVAFYAADAALECALYAEQRAGAISYNANPNSPVPTFKCDGSDPYRTPNSPKRTYSGSGLTAKQILTYRFSLDSGKHCADVTIYWPAPTASQSFYTFAQGYDTSCPKVGTPDGTRFASRGLDVRIIDPTAPLATSCTLTASPETIASGGSAQLTWTTSNAASFSIDHGIGSVTPLSSGSVSVSPGSNTTYQGTATGPGGTALCSDTIAVTSANPTIFDTAGTYQFTVPAGVTSLTVRAWGAGAGSSGGSSAYSGGGGGYVKGTISVRPGDDFVVIVGGGGGGAGGTYYPAWPITGGAGGYAGGGKGGDKASGTASGAGGGGFSGIFISGTTSPILLAGGGGGHSIYSGGPAGGTSGTAGGGYTRSGGGTQVAGGSSPCHAGSAFQGGAGCNAVSGRWAGGGGGGGYFGGGGGFYGAGSGDSGDGGGGGSSYTGGGQEDDVRHGRKSYIPTNVTNSPASAGSPGNTTDPYWNGTAGVGKLGSSPGAGRDGEVVISW
jgi:hypothetical protein